MQVTETKNEGLSREYSIAIAASEFENTVTDRLEKLSKTINMPGFRKGKVPVSIVRKKFGHNVMGEALDQAVNEAANKVLSDNDLRPAMQPKIEIVKFEEGKDIECTMAVEVLPAIELGDLSKIALVRPVVEADEGEVTKTLDRMASAYKSSEPIAKARKTKSGDVVVIDFTGSVDGVEFPGGKAEGYSLELGSGSFIPGFEDQLIGVNVGDDVAVNVKFPDEYGAKDLAGKDAVFACKVNEIREAKPAAIDDELAKKAGMENLDALKAAIRDQHNKGFSEISRQKTKRALLDALNDAYDFELPQGMIDAEYDAIQKAYAQSKDAGQEAGQELEDMSDDERETEFRDIAVRRVKLGLLFAEVGRANKIQVGPDDLQMAVLREAQNYPGQEQMVFKYYKENPQAMQQLSGPVYEDKVVDYIIGKAKVTDKTVSVEDLMAEDEEPKKAAKKPAAKKAAAKTADDADKKPAAKKPAAKKTAAKKKAD